MKTIKGILVVFGASLIGLVISCTTTPPVYEEARQDTAEVPDFESVGLEDGSAKYIWDSYQGTIPFSREVRKSSQVTGGRDEISVFTKPSKRASQALAERKTKPR